MWGRPFFYREDAKYAKDKALRDLRSEPTPEGYEDFVE